LLVTASLRGAEGRLEETTFSRQLRQILDEHLALHHYDLAAQEIHRLLPEYPNATESILGTLLDYPSVRSYLVSKRRLPIIVDNGLPHEIILRIGPDVYRAIPAFRHAELSLPPSSLRLTVLCPHVRWETSYDLSLISPRDHRDHLVVNVGRRNSYRIEAFDLDASRRHKGHATRGWPQRLDRPRIFWFRGDEIFPPRLSNPWSPNERPHPIVSLRRLRPEWFELKHWHGQGDLDPGLF
jgi:hypothetical protein